jgi:pimeloyl-ACP methyl ester carboxylesterase
MPRFLQVATLAVSAVILLAGAALAVSGCHYSREMAIDRQRGIDEAGYVRIGGIDQWIQIRGDDRRNPVLLWLNGGPGFSTISGTRLVRDWEKHFTVVMWDQRGEGRTYLRTGAKGSGPMTVDRMTEDGIEVAEYLRRRLHKSKIILFGHSWGTVLGVGMAKRRPDLFAVYVATGQVTNEQAMMAATYPRVLARARALGNRKAEQDLLAAGPPPYRDWRRSKAWLIWSNNLDPGRLEWPRTAGLPWALIQSRLGLLREIPGEAFNVSVMMPTLMGVDVPALGDRFEVPIVFIQGTEDLNVGTDLVRSYFDSLSAPRKELVLLHGDGHLALFRDRDRFLSALVEHVRPLAADSSLPAGAR